MSLSNKLSSPTPLRASTSTAWPPTPPMPNTATWALRNASSAGVPNWARVRVYWSGMNDSSLILYAAQ